MWNTKTVKTDMIVQCAWCKKIKMGNQWIIPIFDRTVNEKVTHGICPACKEKELSNDHPETSFH
jgi:hypothetical protein